MIYHIVYERKQSNQFGAHNIKAFKNRNAAIAFCQNQMKERYFTKEKEKFAGWNLIGVDVRCHSTQQFLMNLLGKEKVTVSLKNKIHGNFLEVHSILEEISLDDLSDIQINGLLTICRNFYPFSIDSIEL